MAACYLDMARRNGSALFSEDAIVEAGRRVTHAIAEGTGIGRNGIMARGGLFPIGKLLILGLAVLCTACGGGGGTGGGRGGGSSANTSSPTYTVGGSISGLTFDGLVLQDSGGDNLTVAADATNFAFATPLPSGSSYAVSVFTQPNGQTCTMTGGTGTVSGANVTSVLVGCVPGTAMPIGGLGATTASGKIVAFWPPVSGATGYNLYYSSSGTATLGSSKIAGVTSPHILTGVSDGTAYSLLVTAVSSGGESPIAPAISATPHGSPTNGKTTPAGCTGTLAGSDPLFPFQWHLTNTGQTAFAATAGIAGNDIDVGSATQTGCGIKVAVVDSGQEIGHEDLVPNQVPNASIDFTNFDGVNTSLLSTDPTAPPSVTAGDHGTSVSGLIGERSGNDLGGRGVAGEAALVGYNVRNPNVTGYWATYVIALGGLAGVTDDVDIFNESLQFNDFVPEWLTETGNEANPMAAQIASGVKTLRGGKGAIYVKAAGNDFLASDITISGDCTFANAANLSCGNANFDPYNTLPYHIVVGALRASGTKTDYSSAGSAIWVSAPAGEYGENWPALGYTCSTCPASYSQPGTVTTDQTGCSLGYSQSVSPIGAAQGGNGWEDDNDFNWGGQGFPDQVSYNSQCNYMSNMSGTSAATPVTSGSIAVLLQSNPSLTWRDVKYVLAKTAVQVDVSIAAIYLSLGDGSYSAEPAWTTNAAGFHFHNWYGFGRIDLAAAVARASGFTPNGFGRSTAATLIDSGFIGSPAAAPIPDFSIVGGASSISTSGTATASIAFIEGVQVQACIQHPDWGQLSIELTAPSGTRSVMLNAANGSEGYTSESAGPCPIGGTGTQMLLASNMFYGEPSSGLWTLKVVDTVAGNGSNPGGTQQLSNWQIRFLGH